MTLQIEPNRDVTKRLGQFIDRKLRDTRLFNYVGSNRLSYEKFSSWSIPEDSDLLTKGQRSSGLDLTNNYKKEAELNHVLGILKAQSITNAFLYSPMSGLYWHTNSDMPGTRLYYSFTLDKAVFKYKDPEDDQIKEDWDAPGWTARQFCIPDDDRRFWHAVWTSGRRFTFGFNL